MMKTNQNIMKFLPSAWGVIAVCIGLAMPLSYFGVGLQGLLILLAFVMLLMPSVRSHAWQNLLASSRNWQVRALALALLACVPSLFVSAAPAVSVRTWTATVILLLCFGALGGFRYAPRKYQEIAFKILIAGLLILLTLLIAASVIDMYWIAEFWFLAEEAGLTSIKQNDYYTFNHIKLLVAVTFIILPVLCYCVFLYFKQKIWQVLTMAVTVLLLFLAVYITNRSSLAGLIAILGIGMLTLWFSQKINRWMKYLAMLLLLAAITGYSIYVFERFGNNQDYLQGRYVTDKFVYDKIFPPFLPYALIGLERQIYLWEAFHTWQDNPLWGIGINSTNYHEPLQQAVGRYFTQKTAKSMTYVHNRLMEMLLEAGLVGFSAFVAFLAVVFYQNFRRFIVERHIPSLLVLLTHTGYWTSGLFQYSIWEFWTTASFILTLILIHTLDDSVRRFDAAR